MILKGCTRGLLLAVADVLYVDPDGHSNAIVRREILAEARAGVPRDPANPRDCEYFRVHGRHVFYGASFECSECGAHGDGTDMPMAEATAAAERIGTDAGRAAASWVFPASTDPAAYRRVLAGIDDGDPEILDAYDEPRLDGDGSGARDLCDEIGVDYDASTTADVDAICDAYLDASRDSYWHEIERMCHVQLDTEPES